MEKVHVSTKMHSHCCRNLFYDNCIMYRKYEIPYLIWLYIPVYSLQACWSLYSVWNCSLYEWQTICVKWPRVVKKSKHVCYIVQVLHKRLIYMHKKICTCMWSSSGICFLADTLSSSKLFWPTSEINLRGKNLLSFD